MRLSEIAEVVHAKNDVSNWSNIEVNSFQFDSRLIKSGGFFVPLSGNDDGHKYIKKAYEMGALASFCQPDKLNLVPDGFPIVIVDDPLKAFQTLASFWIKKVNPKVIAITGSNGKTTTKDIVASILKNNYRVHETQSSFNNEIGVPFTILSMPEDTEYLVLEMGMDRAGQLDELSNIAHPDIAVITMIGEAHIEFFKTRDRIADAKMEITNHLSNNGTFIFNGDEPLLLKRANKFANEYTFGHINDNYISAKNIHLDYQNYITTFQTNLTDNNVFKLPLMGTYNVDNALPGILIGLLAGIRVEDIKSKLNNLSLTKNRTELLKGQKGETILSDVYNSNPTAVIDVLNVFSNMQTNGKRIVVLGDMLELGDDAVALHSNLSNYLNPQSIDEVYLIGTYIKNLSDILKEKFDPEKIHYYLNDDLDSLANSLKDSITGEDLILLKASHGLHLEKVLANLIGD